MELEIDCPFCKYEGTPIIEERINTQGWIVFAILLFVCLPLCWIPFVGNSFKEQLIRCPSCGLSIGS